MSTLDERGAASETPILSLNDVRVSYGKISALKGVSLDVAEGEILSIIGPNGAGKSTLAGTLVGFHDYEGEIRYAGDDIRERSTSDLVSRGLILSTETRDLFGSMDVEDNLVLGAYRNQDDVEENLAFVYEVFPRLEERRGQMARTMSGGEQQMLAIGRSLMAKPNLLVLDETTFGLAPVVLDDISEAIEEIHDAGVTILLCEQNVTFAQRHASRIVVLENGEVVRETDADALADDDYIRETYLGG